ncbi:hypothetical protein IAE36_000311 [Pseudomonas sp. S36]|nr:hypothetical protein [Pseudomonas sp. S36]
MSYALPPLPQHSRPSHSNERRRALCLISLPLLGALIAFAVAVITTLMGEMAQGSARFYIAALSYTLLVLCVMLLPAYVAGLAWYAWWTRAGDEGRLLRGLWLAPLVAVMFAWFPAAFFPGLQPLGQASADPVRTYLLAGALTLLLGYAWSVVVYMIMRFWRNA